MTGTDIRLKLVELVKCWTKMLSKYIVACVNPKFEDNYHVEESQSRVPKEIIVHQEIFVGTLVKAQLISFP